MSKVFQVSPTFSPMHSVMNDCDYDLSEVDPSDLVAGRTISADDISKVRFGIYERAVNPVYFANILGWPIFQIDFVDQFGWVREGNQVFPVNGKAGALKEYCILRINNYLDLIDLDRSDIEFFEDGGIEWIANLVIASKRLPVDVSIFRLLGFPWDVFVTESVMAKMAGRDDLGFTLKEVPCG